LYLIFVVLLPNLKLTSLARVLFNFFRRYVKHFKGQVTYATPSLGGIYLCAS